jgi:hypothetical protein
MGMGRLLCKEKFSQLVRLDNDIRIGFPGVFPAAHPEYGRAGWPQQSETCDFCEILAPLQFL